MRRALPVFTWLLLTAVPSLAGPTVGVVVGPGAPRLERLAADEIAAKFKLLFDAEVTVAEQPPAGDSHLIYVGSPATNPAVAKALGQSVPKLSDQGHILRSVTFGERKALVVGGGSPAATFWAAAELGHHFGIRTFLHGDVLPEKLPKLKLDGIDVTCEPVVKVRAFRLFSDTSLGFAGWGLDDHRVLLRQLAKLKFNHVVLGSGPAGGRALPVAGDTPGRKAFKGAREYDNPALLLKIGETDRQAAAAGLAQGIRIAAIELGFTVGEQDPKLRGILLPGFLPHVPAELPAADGFIVVAELPGDLSPVVYHLTRRAFDPKLTAKEAYTQFFAPLIGAASTERVQLGFALIDEAGRLAEANDRKVLGPAPDSAARLLKPGDVPDWWKKAGKLYAGAMDEMYRAIRATYNDPARPLLLYYAKRCEFAVHYFAAIDAARLAGSAKAAGDRDTAMQQLEKSIEALYNALNALGDVARDPSDRGAIAMLAEYLYRPLTAELKAVEKK